MLIVFEPLDIFDLVGIAGDFFDGIFKTIRLDIPVAQVVGGDVIVGPIEKFLSVIRKLDPFNILPKLSEIGVHLSDVEDIEVFIFGQKGDANFIIGD